MSPSPRTRSRSRRRPPRRQERADESRRRARPRVVPRRVRCVRRGRRPVRRRLRHDLGPRRPQHRLGPHEDDGKVTLFVGAASGGVWKSLDGGTTFKPVFDKQPVQSIGAIALDPSDPKVVGVGTGETWLRNSVSAGNGVYRSGDGGETWTQMGLPECERVNRIVVSPKKSDVVYACVPGKLWSDSADRGLYKTTDGGKSWALVLKGGNLSTGCSGLAMDPRNPDRLFAGLWDFRRRGWTFRSGGEE